MSHHSNLHYSNPHYATPQYTVGGVIVAIGKFVVSFVLYLKTESNHDLGIKPVLGCKDG